MAFEVQSLDPSVEFENVDPNSVHMVRGKNQMVRWKGSNVTVIELNDEGKESRKKLEGHPNGQGVLAEGSKLWITDGKWLEE
jgi:hypothetical protein